MTPTYTIRRAAGRRPRSTIRPPPRPHFQLDPHARVGPGGGDHCGRRPDIAEVFPEHGPAAREIVTLRNDVSDPHDVGEARAGLLQGGLDVPQALLDLLEQVVRNCHRRIVEAGRAGNEHPLAVDDRSGIADLSLVGRAGADELTGHWNSPFAMRVGRRIIPATPGATKPTTAAAS